MLQFPEQRSFAFHWSDRLDYVEPWAEVDFPPTLCAVVVKWMFLPIQQKLLMEKGPRQLRHVADALLSSAAFPVVRL